SSVGRPTLEDAAPLQAQPGPVTQSPVLPAPQLTTETATPVAVPTVAAQQQTQTQLQVPNGVLAPQDPGALEALQEELELPPPSRPSGERPEAPTTTLRPETFRPVGQVEAPKAATIVSGDQQTTLLDLSALGEAAAEGSQSSGTDRARAGAPVLVTLSPSSPPPQHAATISSHLVGAMSRNGTDRIEIRLDPPELGRVSMTMTITEQAVSALVSAERPEIADLMRRHADQLQRDLSAAGYGDVDLQFSDGAGTGESAEDKGQQAFLFGEAEAGAANGPSLASASLSGTGRLDIRI
ncbi:MAG: flagellar hook-length control protein FliK, partial [Pseudomonadota bacterium]